MFGFQGQNMDEQFALLQRKPDVDDLRTDKFKGNFGVNR